MQTGDTIVAISSAVGPAARMIVRASGPGVPDIHQHLTASKPFEGSNARRTKLTFQSLSVPAWVYTFASPRSVTGEDVIELHIPGNPLLARMLLSELVQLGVRQAEPGEFTARAYFNGRIDLTEAEGVAATIAAHSERELAAARQLLAGELARRLRPVLDQLAETLALVEVGIDFSEEDVTFLSSAQVTDRLSSANRALESLLADSTRFERLSHEPQVILIGRPNAGKSTLLNALAGQLRAVVSDQAGTTRDAIWSHVELTRGAIRLIDVAGLDETPAEDEIARQMQHRARQMIDEADVIALVRDSTDTRPDIKLDRDPDLHIATKADLGGDARTGEIHVSAIRGNNLHVLRKRLDVLAFGPSTDRGATLALNARHVAAIEEARAALSRARDRISDPTAGSELLALELRESLDALGRVLGSVSPDDLLTRIFSTFCIGK
ncbi:MAG TPA: tRNA modification GTPase [Tepidisphaeraceae bacterium]|jgi:tRNA modification GTPase